MNTSSVPLSFFSCPDDLNSFIEAIIQSKVVVAGTPEGGFNIHHGKVTDFRPGFHHTSQDKVFITSMTPPKIERDFYITDGCAIPLSAQKIKQAMDCSSKSMQ